LVVVELTGDQLLKVLTSVVASRDPESGAKIKYRLNTEKKPELISATLVDSKGQEKDIDPNEIYSVATIDYLLNVEGGRYSTLKQGTNARLLGKTMRNALIDYVKSETAAGRPIRARADSRFSLIGPVDMKSGEQPK
jgi:hypothetical protein